MTVSYCFILYLFSIHSASGLCLNLLSAQNVCRTNNVFSLKQSPISCKPIGSPFCPLPHGTVIPEVLQDYRNSIISPRYILSGSLKLSPSFGAVVGAAGPKITSIFCKCFIKCFLDESLCPECLKIIRIIIT